MTVSQTFFVFDDLDSVEKNLSGVPWLPGPLSRGIFLLVPLESWVYHRGQVPYHHITGGVHAIRMTYQCDGDLDHLTQAVVVRCLHATVTLPPSHTVLFGRKSPDTAHT